MGYKVARVPIAEIAMDASPSPSPSSPIPAPSASATPIPQILTPPAGWKPRGFAANSEALKTDRMWIDPNHKGLLISGHLDLPGLSALDLDSLAASFHQGMIAELGDKAVQPSSRVKICGGKEDGILTKVTRQTVTEDILLAVSDRGYVAIYVRRNGDAEDPAATRSLFSLCAPS
jgi:hypothetical protein